MATKISLDFIKKNKRDISFFAVGIILSICLIYLFIDSTSFLVSNVESSLEVGTSPYSPMKFNISGLKSLGIYQEQTTSTGAVTSTESATDTSASPVSNQSPLPPTSSSTGSDIGPSVIPPINP